MKDTMLLLLVASFMSVIAGIFWNFSESHGFDILALLTMTILLIENIRLRRKLKEIEQQDSHST